jgi:hypothetical protein
MYFYFNTIDNESLNNIYKGNSRPYKLRTKSNCLHTYSWETWPRKPQICIIWHGIQTVWMLPTQFSKAIRPRTKAPLLIHLANQFPATGKEIFWQTASVRGVGVKCKGECPQGTGEGSLLRAATSTPLGASEWGVCKLDPRYLPLM